MADVTCVNCNQKFDISQGMSIKKFEGNVTAYGLKCPHCDYYTHSYFETAELVKLKQILRMDLIAFQRSKTERAWKIYQSAKKTFNTIHDVTQEKYAYLLETN